MRTLSYSLELQPRACALLEADVYADAVIQPGAPAEGIVETAHKWAGGACGDEAESRG